eukprot:g26338.t1
MPVLESHGLLRHVSNLGSDTELATLCYRALKEQSECDKISHITCPLDARMATYINVIVIWIGFVVTMLVAHYLRGRYAFAGLCNWGMSVVNAFGGHLMPWLFQGYNPGAFQSLFMFAFGVFAITRPSVQFAAACVLNGVLFHVIAFFVGMNLVFKYHFPAEVVALLGFLCSTAMPLGFARLCAPDDPDDYEKILGSMMTTSIRVHGSASRPCGCNGIIEADWHAQLRSWAETSHSDPHKPSLTGV